MFSQIKQNIALPIKSNLKKSQYLALYEQAVVLYSLRKLTSQATKAIRIRRDSDSVEKDIAFVGKDLDQQAIKDFGGKNLLSNTEDLNNPFYFKSRSNISEVSNVTVNGNKVFDFSELTTDNDEHYLQATLNSLGNNVLYTVSLIVKSNTRSRVRVAIFMPTHGVAVQHFNLANGTITDTNDPQNIASSIEPFGSDGFYKISLTMMSGTNTLVKPQIVILNNNNQQTYVGNGKGIFISSLQVEVNQSPTTYEPRLTGGASDCTIVRWYDHVGTNHSVQNNIALQPKIYDVESGEVTKENGKPASIFDGADDNIPILNVAGRSNIDAYFVNRHYLGNTIYPFGTNSIVGGTYGFVVQQNSSSTLITSNYGNPNLYKNKVLFAGTTRNNIYNFLGQTQNIVNHQDVNVSSWDTFDFGNFPSNQFRFEGTLQEIIVFADNLTTAERQILHNDINNYYAIY
jgi:hypothetical protein